MIKNFMLDCSSDCGCSCGGCDFGFDPDHSHDTMILSLDDDTELECTILSVFPAGDKEYIALLPIKGKEAEEGEVFLYRYQETPDGEPSLENIEDDDEYELVADAFEEILDGMEYDETVDEEESV